jgi:hypothetical protein
MAVFNPTEIERGFLDQMHEYWVERTVIIDK